MDSMDATSMPDNGVTGNGNDNGNGNTDVNNSTRNRNEIGNGNTRNRHGNSRRHGNRNSPMNKREMPTHPLKRRQKSNMNSLVNCYSNISSTNSADDSADESTYNSTYNSTYKGTGTPPTTSSSTYNNNSVSKSSLASSQSLFKSILLKRRDTLTRPENQFLEVLIDHGDEDDLHTAMMVLADDLLFFKQQQQNKTKNDVDGIVYNIKELDDNNVATETEVQQQQQQQQQQKYHRPRRKHLQFIVDSTKQLFQFATTTRTRTTVNNNDTATDNNDTTSTATDSDSKNCITSTLPPSAAMTTSTTPSLFDNVEIIEREGKAIIILDELDEDKHYSRNHNHQMQLSSHTPTKNKNKNHDNMTFEEYTPTRSNKTVQGEYLHLINAHEIMKNNVKEKSSHAPTPTPTTTSKTNQNNSNDDNTAFITPPNHTATHKLHSSNISMTTTTSSLTLGSSKRISRVAQRRHSKVHADMWRAHYSGITLTPPPMRTPLPALPLIQQQQKQQHIHNRHHSTVSFSTRRYESPMHMHHQRPPPSPLSTSVKRRQDYASHHHRLPSTGKSQLHIPLALSASSSSSYQHFRSLSSSRLSKLKPILPTPSTQQQHFISSRIIKNPQTLSSSASSNIATETSTNDNNNDTTTTNLNLEDGKCIYTRNDSIHSFPGIELAPAFQSPSTTMASPLGSSIIIDHDDDDDKTLGSSTTIGNHSIYHVKQKQQPNNSFASLKIGQQIQMANDIESMSNSTHSIGNGSVEFVDVNHRKNKQWLNLQKEYRYQQVKDSATKYNCLDHHHNEHEYLESLDLALHDQKWNNKQPEDHTLNHDSNSIQSLDLANQTMYVHNSSSASLPSSFDLFADSSTPIPSIRRIDPMQHPNNSILATVLSQEVIDDDIFQGFHAVDNNANNSTPLAHNRALNLQHMREKSLMSSLTSSRTSLDDSFISSNLRTKSVIAFDDSDLRSCKSDDTSIYITDRSLQSQQQQQQHVDDNLSWDPYNTVAAAAIDNGDEEKKFDAWNVLMSEYEEFGYGIRGLEFKILGTSADDSSSQPHVLSPPLMESLFQFLPFSVSEDNYWMKYSLVRDGASFFKLLQNVRGSKSTLIAIETVDGEVFGSFTSSPWRKNASYFGSGEAFLWKMRNDRTTECKSIIDQAQLESEIEVYPWTGNNYFVQLCSNDHIAVGGGVFKSNDEAATESGFGLCIDDEVLQGTSQCCATFNNPPLSKEHQDGSPFEIVNLEVWTFTPTMTVQEAEKIEFGRLFLELHTNDNTNNNKK